MGDPAYIAGDYWVICDECGFKKRSSQTKMRWDNLRVCSSTCWEPRHPQDFVRGKKDRQRVPNARPEQPDVFLELNQVTEDNLTGAPVDRILTPAAAAVAYIGYAPLLPIFAPAASVTYSSAAPEIIADDILRPAAASVTYTGQAPSVAAGANVKPASASVTYTGQTPLAWADVLINPAAASVTYAGQAPTILIDDAIFTPAAASVSYASNAPTILLAITAQPANASVTYTGQTPTVLSGDVMVDGSSNRYVDESGNVYGIV